MTRFKYLLITCVFSSLSFFAGCDTSVQQTVLSGMETGSTAITSSLIKALFQSLATDPEASTSQTNTTDTTTDTQE
jgi:hypothetical protein